MASIDAIAANLRRLDEFARDDTAVHRLDPRAKVVATLAFVVTVASFDRYTVAALMPFAVFPIVLAVLGKLLAGYLAKNVALAVPFALVIGLFNPFLDREVVSHLGSLPITAGWISCVSIVVGAVLTLGAALVLVALTGFPAVCGALERLGMPASSSHRCSSSIVICLPSPLGCLEVHLLPVLHLSASSRQSEILPLPVSWLKGQGANALPWRVRFQGGERVGGPASTVPTRRGDQETCRHLVFRALVHGVDRVAVLV